MATYYNEIDPSAAQWLRNLIESGHIAPGDVDERSIEDVTPGDLAGYTQCHFFAGIGVWSYALRRAGWPDDLPVWTGSCPCQPFSSAGVQAGFDDERHLWPHFQWLIEQCRPAVIFGEQVASKAVEPWIDLVQTDLEGLGYAFAGIPFPSAGVGAPHIRDRLFWVAHANGGEQQGQPVIRGLECHRENAGRPQGVGKPESHGDICGLADANGERFHRIDAPVRPREVRDAEAVRCSQADDHQPGVFGGICGVSEESVGLADADGARLQGKERGRQAGAKGSPSGHPAECSGVDGTTAAGPTNGFWADADWLFCRDGKWRPVEPGTFPLAHGAPARVVRLRAYGNAINAEAAREFIEAYLDTQTGG